MSYRALQILALVLAVILYGAFGSPTPDNPGLFEVALAALLLISAGVSGLWLSLRFNLSAPLWLITGQVFLVFGFSVPLVGGVIGGHDLSMIIRDLAAFMFLILPLFFIHLTALRPVLLVVTGAGLLFALRAYFELPFLASGEALFYLANAPTVLFAAILLAGLGIENFVTRFSIVSLLKAAGLIGLSALCLLPMIETQQRASLGAFIISMSVLLAVSLWRNPRRSSFVLVVILGVTFAYSGQLLGVFEDLNRKTALVGVNMRAEEWAAVWQEISSNPISVVFGRGWGAMFSSPAVADITVNYTHGLASSLLLKTGLAGLALGLTYLFLLGKELYPLFRKMPVLSLALAAPVVIDVFLYASFKSLDFGLMLLLMSLLVKTRVFYGEDRRDAIASGEGLLYSEDVAKQS